ncbi:MAG: LysM peptidoglycan-binding domain-containing protein [Atribacterota bacterium]
MRVKGRKIIFGTVLIIVFFCGGTFFAWGATYHVVQPGENPWIIARRYQVPLSKLLQMNGLSKESVLQPGMKILVNQDEENPSSQSFSGYYEVKKGDTLWSIARKLNTSVRAIMEVNGLEENAVLQIGQKILLPTALTAPMQQNETSTTIVHIVKQGESLWLISRFYGVGIKSIMDANGLNEHSVLQVGMKLAIPGIAVSRVTSSTPEVSRGSATQYATYCIQPGDTLWVLARRFQVSVSTLAEANGLTEKSILRVGQTIKIPSSDGRVLASGSAENYEIYRIQPGDTLWSLSRRFRIAVDVLAKANGLNQKSVLRVGQAIKIPSSLPRQYVKVDGQGNFLWPVRGRISSTFGPRGRSFHNGVDIIAPSGTLIRAAQSGVVSFSGTMRGYGRIVIVDHPGGWQTVYAHNSVNLVTRGQRVNQGDPIAKVGRTGNATTAHLHFEVRRNGKCMDPLQFLRK